MTDSAAPHTEALHSISVRLTRIFPARKWKVLRLLTRVENYKNFMPHVKECQVLEKKPRGAVTAWKADVEGIPVGWKEEDVFDFENFTVSFRAFEGDLEKFEGQWRLEELPGGKTRVTLEVNLKIGLPLMEEMLEDSFRRIFSKSFERMFARMSDQFMAGTYRVIHDRRISTLKGFGIIAHPYNLNHLLKHFKFHKPDFRAPSLEFLVETFNRTPAYRFHDVPGFRSRAGKTTRGVFIMCPIVPDLVTLDAKKSIEKVIGACRVAEELGLGIAALGGFSSIAAQHFGPEILSSVHVPMTTGNTFTTAMTLEGVYKAARLMRLDLGKAKVTIIGGAGDIGGTCARMLAEQVAEITLTGRSEKNLISVERAAAYAGRAVIKTTKDNAAAVRGADIVIAAASVPGSILNFDLFKPGAIICDVGYPKNISYTPCDRKDIFVFSGGITRLPMAIDLGYDTGLPSPEVLYGCFAEGILLDLEEHYENFSWGRGNITKEKIGYMLRIAKKHGFELAPFFWGERLLDDEEVASFAGVRK